VSRRTAAPSTSVVAVAAAAAAAAARAKKVGPAAAPLEAAATAWVRAGEARVEAGVEETRACRIPVQ